MPAPTAETTHPADDVLAREQAHLDHAREQLRRMREATDRLEAGKATDAWTSQLLGLVLARRVASLQDDPHTTLFFGRIDMRTEHGEETFHVGRRHVSDDRGDPVVVDWRAPISTAFYRASTDRPDGRRAAPPVRRRPAAGSPPTRTSASPRGDVTDHSAILAAEIERPRTGPMRDIVSTIQPEQDEIVRSDLGDEHLRAGRPGHRQDRRRPAPGGVAALLVPRPARPLRRARRRARTGPSSTTSAPCCRRWARPGSATPRSTPCSTTVRVRARGHHRGGDAQGRRAARRGAAPRRVVARRPPRRGAGGASRVTPLAGARRTRSRRSSTRSSTRGRALLGRPRPAPAAPRPPRAAADGAHRRLPRRPRAAHRRRGRRRSPRTSARSGRRSTRPACSSASSRMPRRSPHAADGILTADEQRTAAVGASLLAPRARPGGRGPTWPCSTRSPTCSTARPSLGHVVLDEAQDLSPMQLRAVGRRASTGSLTVLGDIAQGTTPWATQSWEDAMRHLGRPAHELVVLDRGFRVPGLVIEFAARLLPHMAPGLGAPTVGARQPGPADRRPPRAQAHGRAAVAEAVRAAVDRPGLGGRHRGGCRGPGAERGPHRGRHPARPARRRAR